MKIQELFIIFLASLFFCIALNEININYIKKNNPQNHQINTKSLVENTTVYSIDNQFYTTQIKNIEKGFGYTLDPKNPEMKVRRTPVYPLFYGFFYLVFGENAELVIKWTQVLLFALSSVLLGITVYNLFQNKLHAILSASSYGLSPFIASYTYFTITESLTPFLIVLALYFFSLYYRSKSIWLLLATGSCIGILFLNRPVGGIILVTIGAFIFFENWNLKFEFLKRKVFLILFLSLGFALSITPWTIRNYLVTNGEIILAEKYYYSDPMDFGRAHIYFRYWISSWTNPANYSAERLSSDMIINIRNGEPQKNGKLINSYLEALPKEAFSVNPKSEISLNLEQLNSCFIEMFHPDFGNGKLSKKAISELDCQNKTAKLFQQSIEKYKDERPLNYFVFTPVKTLKEIIFQSNSSNLAFLNPDNRDFKIWQILIKALMYLLNFTLWVSFAATLFIRSFKMRIPIFCTFIILYLALSLLLFRYVESRYFLPLFPLFYICFGFLMDMSIKKAVYFKKLIITK